MADFDSWKSTAVRLATETAGIRKGIVILDAAADIKLRELYDRLETPEYASNIILNSYISYGNK